MSLLIPTRSDLPFYDLQVPLDGVTYTLEFRRNVRVGAWFMNGYDITGTVLYFAGVKLVADFPLAAYNTARQPAGFFIAKDTSGQGIDPGINDLGVRVQLVYVTVAELNALREGLTPQQIVDQAI
jgi:hypothetical protein